jgi:spore germination cell wall hydrolase CwlJ-like protein
MSSRTAPTSRWIYAVLLALVVFAIAVPVVLVQRAPKTLPVAARVKRPERVVPRTVLPTVEPIAFQDLAPQDARAFNASVPFSTAPNPAARPFKIFGDDAARARAIDCLAAAVIYEAGDDATGERAVAQVVLNRVRHPAFPNSVCAVVFQGAERRTGCQFTFTCDGAIMRAVRPEAWERARQIARMALTGSVDKRVGHATHYHTDWVVPYWSSSLDKITEVHTHLFFRWSGWWGTPPAFRSSYTGSEPVIPQLARLSEAHRTAAEAAGLPLPPLVDGVIAGGDAGVLPVVLEQDKDTFVVTLDPAAPPETFFQLAMESCGKRIFCKFMAWSSRAATPAALPITPVQQRAMSFSYLRDRAFNFERALWNCAEFKRPEPTQCMKAQPAITMAAPPPTNFSYDATPGSALKGIAGALPKAVPAGVDPLTGVRRKGDPAAPVPMTGPPPVSPTDPQRKAAPAQAAPKQ